MDAPRHLQGFNVRLLNEDATIAEAESAADLAEIRTLFVEYQQWLGVDLCFQDFAEEIDSLPGRYAPPAGSLLLARTLDGAVAGGVGMWPLEQGVCEMKRLFVRPPWRGAGLGRRLAMLACAWIRSHTSRPRRYSTDPWVSSRSRPITTIRHPASFTWRRLCKCGARETQGLRKIRNVAVNAHLTSDQFAEIDADMARIQGKIRRIVTIRYKPQRIQSLKILYGSYFWSASIYCSAEIKSGPGGST